MNLSKVMLDSVQIIKRIERKKLVRKLNVPSSEIGNSLIEIYYQTDNLRTRELIMSFMNEAGVCWMRKLITRDTSEMSDAQVSISSIDNYVNLIAANDAQNSCDQSA